MCSDIIKNKDSDAGEMIWSRCLLCKFEDLRQHLQGHEISRVWLYMPAPGIPRTVESQELNGQSTFGNREVFQAESKILSQDNMVKN